MKSFPHVRIQSIVHDLPEEVWSTSEIEKRLSPMYERLGLREGRLELMTGIRERRMCADKIRIAELSAGAGKKALQESGVSADKVQCLVHCGVSRDGMEPATATGVHQLMGLSSDCLVFDLSNACLGFLNACTLVAGMIERGEIKCGLVVTGENGRPLVDHTIEKLNASSYNRQEIKPHFASLTIGCGSAAAVLTHRDICEEGYLLQGGAYGINSSKNDLCQGDSEGSGISMETDSEALLIQGVELAKKTWADFEKQTGWSKDTPSRIVCHQVGVMHRKKLYEELHLDLSKDFSTFEFLGNTGSAALPMTLAFSEEAKPSKRGDKIALLGIGSGINCMMLALEKC